MQLPTTVTSAEEANQHIRSAYAHIIGYLQSSLRSVALTSTDQYHKDLVDRALAYSDEVWKKALDIKVEYPKI